MQQHKQDTTKTERKGQPTKAPSRQPQQQPQQYAECRRADKTLVLIGHKVLLRMYVLVNILLIVEVNEARRPGCVRSKKRKKRGKNKRKNEKIRRTQNTPRNKAARRPRRPRDGVRWNTFRVWGNRLRTALPISKNDECYTPTDYVVTIK